MSILKKIVAIFLGLLLIFGGIAHFVSPEFYNGLIPYFLPKTTINYITGFVELILGIGVLIPVYRKKALLGIFTLMIIFLPVHIVDAIKEDPVIGTKVVAYIRILIQFVLIYLPWYARSYRKTSTE